MKKLQLYACLLFIMASTITFSQNPFTTIIESDEYQETISDQDIQTRDQVFADDLIVQGSACVGLDCNNGENFGFDTFRMKENNLRMHFDDTSGSASFPSNDWRFIFNDSSNGGANYFGIDDATAGTNPFRIAAGAGNNALYVSASGGNVGLGTASPVVELHVTDGDSPTMRLEQNGSNGWTPQTWDVAGNETNFFVRDVTNGSKLPFKIKPGAPDNALYIAATGNIGLGTANPNANASLVLAANNKGLQLNRMDNAGRTALGTALGAGEVGVLVFDTEDNSMYTWDGATWIAGGTDDQALTLNVDSLELEDGGSVDLSGYLDNTDDQGADVFQLNGDDLELSLEDDGVATQTVDLSGYLDNTDDQRADVFQLNGDDLELSLEDDGVATQTVDLSGYLDNTDDQGADVFQLNGDDLELSLEDDGVATQTVDLSGYLDNTDDQNISGSGFASNMLTIGIESGASEIIDLSSLDNSGTDDQQLTLSGNNLDLEDGGSVSLAGYLDNTDNQNISGSNLSGNTLTIGIENGTSDSVDLSSLDNSGTDDQQLSLTGNNLDLEDGGSVNLAGYLDNTDNQNISGSNLIGNTLTIGVENGASESVDLSSLDNSGTDDQNLANFILSAGSLLSLSIENGNVVSVSLAPLLDELSGLVSDLQAENAAQQAQIDDLIIRMQIREECACDPALGLDDNNLDPNRAYLLQNIPNPFDNTTTVGYFVPYSNGKANIVISNMAGQIINNIQLSKFGAGSISVNKSRMATATYMYTLFVDGKRIDTKRMLVE